jgi:hypothetical protein
MGAVANHLLAGSRRARVALARKLAVILLTMWTNGTQFEPFPALRDALLAAEPPATMETSALTGSGPL